MSFLSFLYSKFWQQENSKKVAIVFLRFIWLTEETLEGVLCNENLFQEANKQKLKHQQKPKD